MSNDIDNLSIGHVLKDGNTFDFVVKCGPQKNKKCEICDKSMKPNSKMVRSDGDQASLYLCWDYYEQWIDASIH